MTEQGADDLYEHRNDPDEWDDQRVEVGVRPADREVVSFRLPSDELDRLVEAAQAAGESLSQFVRTALSARLAPSGQALKRTLTSGSPAVAESLSLSEAKIRLPELADRIESQYERIMVTRQGRPSFVLMSLDDLESLEETLEILQDEELLRSLRLSQQDAAVGKLIPLHEVV